MNENLPNKLLLDSVQDLNFSDGHSNLSSTTDKKYWLTIFTSLTKIRKVLTYVGNQNCSCNERAFDLEK